MPTAIIEHHVKDYPTWRRAFSENERFRQRSNVREARVYQSTEDPNMVCVVMTFPATDDAEAFLQNPDLRRVMEEAGVEGTPRVAIAAETTVTTPTR